MSENSTGMHRPLPVARRLTMRPHRSRAAILAAARELFRSRPSDSVSMEMIAMRAGVTRRTVYNQFADSAELFRATREELILEVAELLPLGVAGDLSPRAALRAYCGLVAEAFADPRYVELVGSIVRDGWAAPWLIDAYQRHIRVPATRSLETYLQGLRADDVLGSADIRRAALNLIASIESVAVSTRLLPGIDRNDCEIADCTPDLIDGFMSRVCGPAHLHPSVQPAVGPHE